MTLWMMWLIAAIALLVVEMTTPGTFFFLCFALGALVATASSALGFGNVVTWVTFLVSSTLLILIIKPLISKFTATQDLASNVDELIGKEALVLEAIAPHYPGKIRVGGEQWRAEATTDIQAESTVIITKVSGATVTVKEG